MGFADANKHLQSTGNPGLKFESVGDTHEGTLTDVDLQPQTNPEGEVQKFPSGDTKMQLILTLQTDERDPKVVGDTGVRKAYLSWRAERKLKDAYKAAGAEGLEPNAHIRITFTGEEKVPGQMGKAKLYDVEYTRPVFKAGSLAEEPVADKGEEFPDQTKIDLARTLVEQNTPYAVVAQVTGIPADKIDSYIAI